MTTAQNATVERLKDLGKTFLSFTGGTARLVSGPFYDKSYYNVEADGTFLVTC